MARRKKRKSKKTRRRRKNPAALVAEAKAEVMDVVSVDKAKKILAGGVGSAVALGLVKMAVEKTPLAAILGDAGTIVSGVVTATLGSVVATMIAKRAGLDADTVNFVGDATVLLGAAEALDLVTTPLKAMLGLSGWEEQHPGLSGLGQSYCDEFGRSLMPGGDCGLSGLGQNVVAKWSEEDAPNFKGYEPLGDIMNNQRLGSFEYESGFGSVVQDIPNARDQQVADEMRAAQTMSGYEGFGQDPSTLFTPSILDPFITG